MTTSRHRLFRRVRSPAGPFRLLAVTAAVGAAAPAQVQWTAETFIDHRVGHVMAYDAARQRVVLFGGNDLTQQLADTWEWDGMDWLARSPASVPPVRSSAGMTWDDRRRVVLMFGGRYGPAFLRDTWEWNGQDWTRRFPATSPPADGYWQRLAFDSVRGRAVLVGSPPAGVFEWDGTDWHDVSPSAGPPSGSWALGWDGNRARTTLVGWVGTGGSCDIWEWDGVAWLQRAPAMNPERRYVHALAWDSGRSRLVLFGGIDGLNDTWEWDGSRWTEASSGTPSRRNDPVMTYDAARRQLVVVGGQTASSYSAGTWMYGPVDPAAFAGYGAGCAGSAGTPSLWPASPADLPWLGEAFTLRLGNLPPGQPAFAVIGASRTAWFGLPLPLDLGPLGMPGCALRASVDLAVAVVNQAGAARIAVSVPNARQLVGGRLYAQGIALDPAANRLGATVSDSGAGEIGAK